MNDHKQKAIELVKKFMPYVNSTVVDGWVDVDVALENAKKCAHIVVDEVIEGIKEIDWAEVQNLDRVNVWWENVQKCVNEITSNDI